MESAIQHSSERAGTRIVGLDYLGGAPASSVAPK